MSYLRQKEVQDHMEVLVLNLLFLIVFSIISIIVTIAVLFQLKENQQTQLNKTKDIEKQLCKILTELESIRELNGQNKKKKSK